MRDNRPTAYVGFHASPWSGKYRHKVAKATILAPSLARAVLYPESILKILSILTIVFTDAILFLSKFLSKVYCFAGRSLRLVRAFKSLIFTPHLAQSITLIHQSSMSSILVPVETLLKDEQDRDRERKGHKLPVGDER
jgi:hypothetical protein